MRSQFWNKITPVKGVPIPRKSEWSRAGRIWYPFIGQERFVKRDETLQVRVPVEACPMSIAVDAIAAHAVFTHEQHYQVWVSDAYVIGCTEQALKDAIASRLRELADKEFPE